MSNFLICGTYYYPAVGCFVTCYCTLSTNSGIWLTAALFAFHSPLITPLFSSYQTPYPTSATLSTPYHTLPPPYYPLVTPLPPPYYLLTTPLLPGSMFFQSHLMQHTKARTSRKDYRRDPRELTFAIMHRTSLSFICSFVYSFLHWFIRLFIHLFIHLFARSLDRWFVPSLIYSLIRLLVHSIIRSCIHSPRLRVLHLSNG